MCQPLNNVPETNGPLPCKMANAYACACFYNTIPWATAHNTCTVSLCTHVLPTDSNGQDNLGMSDYTAKIRVFHVKLTFSMVCIIEVSLCTQHIYIVFISLVRSSRLPEAFLVQQIRRFQYVLLCDKLGEVFPAATGVFSFVNKTCS